MSNKPNFPETLCEAVVYFSDENRAWDFVVEMRWPGSICCPQCGSTDVRFRRTRKNWLCKDCVDKREFSVRIGTIFENSPLPLGKWMIAVWMLVNAKNGISSYELHRSIGVTQKTAWSMLHRIRFALHCGSFDKPLEGRVEADETYIGGKFRNMNKRRRVRYKGLRGNAVPKAIVAGLLERNGEVRMTVVENAGGKALQRVVRENVAEGANLLTDENSAYRALGEEYVHEAVNHAVEYARGHVHTNGLENFWSLLKRALHGTYVSVEPFHLFRYLDEQCFRFNRRKQTDQERFIGAAGGFSGKRLDYHTLTGAGQKECVS